MSTASPDWTAPGVYQVAPGVHRVPLPLPNDGLRAVNVYIISDGDDLVLIDSGWALTEARERLAKALAELGAGFGDVRRFLVTHIHRDHYTQAVALRREFGARISLGIGEQPSLRELTLPDHRSMAWQAAQLRESGAEEVLDALTRTVASSDEAARNDMTLYEPPDDWLSAGPDAGLGTRTLRVVPTPGHTRGHVVFVDEHAGLLFAGDHVLPHITPSIGFEPAPSAHPLRDYLDSLRLVRTLPDLRLLPAHGQVTPSTHDRIDELIDHHDRRLRATAAAVGDGPATAYRVARALSWTRRERKLGDLDPFNQALAVLETGAHLDVLALRGDLIRDEVAGEVRYSPAAGRTPADG